MRPIELQSLDDTEYSGVFRLVCIFSTTSLNHQQLIHSQDKYLFRFIPPTSALNFCKWQTLFENVCCKVGKISLSFLPLLTSNILLSCPRINSSCSSFFFKVSIMAMEESRVLIWHRDKLKLSIMAEPFLQAVFDHILGRDVVKKLMQVTQVSTLLF